MPKPSHLRSIDSTSAPAAQGASVRASGVSVESAPKAGQRRFFSAAEKLRIVREAAACTERGEIEALLRREGIYSSHLAAWRKRGRKPKLDAKDKRIAELEKRNAKLEAKLALTGKLLDLQKKAASILGIELATDEES